MLPELARLSVPLLFLRGQQDRIISPRGSKRARALKPDASFVTIPGPHLLLQARPAAAWQHIEPFVEKALAAPRFREQL